MVQHKGDVVRGGEWGRFHIILLELHHFHCWLGYGPGTNTRAELMALWGLLHFTNKCGILNLQVLGDSKTIIDWVKGKTKLNVISLEHWCKSVLVLKSTFIEIFYGHVFREVNQVVDCLSKKASDSTKGLLFIKGYINEELYSKGCISLYE